MQDITITKKEIVRLSDENIIEVIRHFFERYQLRGNLNRVYVSEKDGKIYKHPWDWQKEPTFLRDASKLEQSIYYIMNHFDEFLEYSPYKTDLPKLERESYR